MKMNLKIVLGVCIAFIITFGGLYLAVNFSDEDEKIDDKKDFFLSQSKLNENTRVSCYTPDFYFLFYFRENPSENRFSLEIFHYGN